MPLLSWQMWPKRNKSILICAPIYGCFRFGFWKVISHWSTSLKKLLCWYMYTNMLVIIIKWSQLTHYLYCCILYAPIKHDFKNRTYVPWSITYVQWPFLKLTFWIYFNWLQLNGWHCSPCFSCFSNPQLEFTWIPWPESRQIHE